MESELEKRSVMWTGESTFVPNSGQTVWGYYDNDPVFASTADPMARWVALKCGYPNYDVELDSGSIYAMFEEAVGIYARELYNFQLRDNYFSLLGTQVSTFNQNTLIVPSLGQVIRLAKTYGSEAGVGGTTTYHSGSIQLIANQQNYDLNQWAIASASIVAGDAIEIKKIYYHGIPASVRSQYSLYGGTQGNSALLNEFGFTGGVGVNASVSLLMPLHLTLLQDQQTELFDDIRRSAYSFELINNQLKIFPLPIDNRTIYFEYIKVSERDNSLVPVPSGSITNVSQVPYGNIAYSSINGHGRTFIAQYTLALAMDKLAMIRGLFGNSIPTPNNTVMLNTPDLIAASTALKTDLLTELRDFFLATSRKVQLEQKQAEAAATQATLANVPLPIYIG